MTPRQSLFAQEKRQMYRDMIPAAGAPDPVAEVRALRIPGSNPAHDIPVRLYVPAGAAGVGGLPIVIFVHGGGWISGDFDTHEVVTRAVANGTGALVLSVDYRLGPEHPFPAGLEDVYETLRWAHAHAVQIGGDPERIAFAGDSAGGNLIAATTLLARDRGGPAIIAQWLMYPLVSTRMDTDSWQRLGDAYFPTLAETVQYLDGYLPAGSDPLQPLMSPLLARLDHLPPALVQVGELDPLHDQALQYAAALAKAGNDATGVAYPDSTHGFVQFYKDAVGNPQGERALREGVHFLASRLAAASRR